MCGRSNHGRAATLPEETETLWNQDPLTTKSVYQFSHGQNNLRIWAEQMENYAMNKYGYRGLLFQTNKYYVPEEVEYPSTLDDGSDPLSEDNDPGDFGGFLAEDYKSQIRSRREHIKKMEWIVSHCML
jgi:hypothetical protein